MLTPNLGRDALCSEVSVSSEHRSDLTASHRAASLVYVPGKSFGDSCGYHPKTMARMLGPNLSHDRLTHLFTGCALRPPLVLGIE